MTPNVFFFSPFLFEREAAFWKMECLFWAFSFLNFYLFIFAHDIYQVGTLFGIKEQWIWF